MSLAGVVLVLAVAVGNVKALPLMPADDVHHDMASLFALAPAVVCANEVAPLTYKAQFRSAARAAGYRTRALATDNPVAIREGWRVVRWRVERLTEGVPHLTPDRSVTVAVVQAPGGGRAAVLCTHLVSRAWTHQEASTGLRQALWRQAAQHLRAIVRAAHRRGLPVVVAGDLNKPDPAWWSDRQVVLANQGLIQATVVPADGQRARRVGGRTVSTAALFTDHPMVRRVVRLEPLASAP